MHLPRFTVRRLMAAVAVVACALAFISAEDVKGVGYATIRLRFSVLDAQTGQPISGANIRLLGGPDYLTNPTGLDGQTKLDIHAMCTTSGPIFRRRRGVNFGFWMLHVDAKDYLKFEGELNEHTTDRRFHDFDAIPPLIQIRLRKSPDLPEPE